MEIPRPFYCSESDDPRAAMPPPSTRGESNATQALGGAGTEEAELEKNWIFVCVSSNWKYNSLLYTGFNMILRLDLISVLSE